MNNYFTSCTTNIGNDQLSLRTQVWNNEGLSTAEQRKLFNMKNTSGSTFAQGTVVVLKSVAAGNEVTTTTTAGDNTVFGVSVDAPTTTTFGFVQTEGYCFAVNVDGTGTAIAIGDYLSCHTSAGVAHKAVAGETVFARALAASSLANTIACMLVQPFKI